MSYTVQTLILTGGLLLGMLGLVFLGRAMGVRRFAKYGEAKVRGNVVDVAVFGLLSLLIAFSFNGAISRFDVHRKLIADEVNAIGTAYLRIDLLPDRAQPALRDSFRDYVQSRIDVYGAMLDPNSPAALMSSVLRARIWRQAIAGCRAGECPAAAVSLMFAGLNQMFDFPVNQALLRNLHPPPVVFVLLFGMALLCAFFVGQDLAGMKKFWLYGLAYPATMTAIMWVILDVEFPRIGVIRVSDLDQMLVTLRATM